MCIICQFIVNLYFDKREKNSFQSVPPARKKKKKQKRNKIKLCIVFQVHFILKFRSGSETENLLNKCQLFLVGLSMRGDKIKTTQKTKIKQQNVTFCC